ncbi:hypothetical protein F9278_43465 [Streptomyces phaeolivaceus]|uniref:Uncharacterized protein n=1 Tax=Streptomyces phaeolivaceus TaxID=2653200 RepID=A0A5P8KGZ8_9ACTN|nr:hypothetical protein [Streptomyces phaeolivaceus]QFR01908.1 hypothetical protein F9278_43465 [Streptomyces phaeolivaceus]
MRIRVTSRLNWTFSARLSLGHAGPPRRPRPLTAMGRRLSTALVRSAMRATLPRRLPPTATARRAAHLRHHR